MRRLLAAASALVVLVVLVAGGRALVDPGRLTPAERADPLAPWTLERGQAPPRAGADTLAAAPSLAPSTAAPSGPSVEPDAGERVLVVHCRQLLVSNPAHARRLRALLQAGADLDSARRAIGGIEVDERRRHYAAADLDAGIRDELAALPDSAWSQIRPWRGRSALFQVLAREERARGTLPALGQGLDEEERQRMARRFRAAPAPVAAPIPPDLEPAAVLQQAQPVVPAGVTQGGEVTVLVEVGRLGEVVSARVQSASDPGLQEAALEAARRSHYRPANRSGVPVQGTVTVTFRFASPLGED